MEEVRDIKGKGSGGVDARRSESVVSDVTRQSDSGLLTMSGVRRIDYLPLGAGVYVIAPRARSR